MEACTHDRKLAIRPVEIKTEFFEKSAFEKSVKFFTNDSVKSRDFERYLQTMAVFKNWHSNH